MNLCLVSFQGRIRPREETGSYQREGPAEGTGLFFCHVCYTDMQYGASGKKEKKPAENHVQKEEDSQCLDCAFRSKKPEPE